MKNYIGIVKLFFKRFFLVVLIYQLNRLLFLIFNTGSFNHLTLKTFLGGLRFDLSALAYINMIFALLHFLPGAFKYKPRFQKGLKISFYVVNIIFILTNFVDFEYYKFTGRRSSFGMLTASGMENEIGGLIVSFISEFWYLPLTALVLAILFWKTIPSLKQDFLEIKTTKIIVLKQTGLLILFLGVLLLLGRGGFQKKPLTVVDAVRYGSISHSALVLNTPFCILKTIGKNETLKSPKFFIKEELATIFNPEVETNPSKHPTKQNVVVIILESFGRENIQRGQTPFLDSLITKSLFFENAFANGKLSIDAVPSTLSSIPSLMSSSLITSSYSVNEIYGLPKILKDNGYNTSFFHGAFNGSQNFDQYCKAAGFDAYYGKDEYDGQAFDGKWGIFDEEFFQFYCKKMSTFKQPFFTSVFSISSHNPYTIPKKHKGKFPKGTTKIHKSIAYTDYALKEFFNSAKKQAWYNNTLFVITADHTSAEPTAEKFKTNVGKFRIPILFYCPQKSNFQGINLKNMQQIDILPSIVDLLQIKTKMITFGKSYKSDKDFVVYYLDNIYHYIVGDYYMAFDGKKPLALYNFKKDELLKNNLLNARKDITDKMELFIKGYIQSFNERIINNQLTVS